MSSPVFCVSGLSWANYHPCSWIWEIPRGSYSIVLVFLSISFAWTVMINPWCYEWMRRKTEQIPFNPNGHFHLYLPVSILTQAWYRLIYTFNDKLQTYFADNKNHEWPLCILRIPGCFTSSFNNNQSGLVATSQRSERNIGLLAKMNSMQCTLQHDLANVNIKRTHSETWRYCLYEHHLSREQLVLNVTSVRLR